jgi:hypothetical protein
MANWWEKAYPGGKMVAVKGFPRSLYPPDAAPQYKPSVDGSDVEGYKRTVSRAGRWVWQKFDQSYSNNFAHGKPGGNVPETGIAGVQRQGGLQDTGYVGEKTFNLLRSIVIPKGLPHAGEYAMDATAVELINAAFDRFKGKEDPTPTGSAAEARLYVAQGELGYIEGNNNSNKYGEWYGQNHQPWCAMFCTWSDKHCKLPADSFAKGSRYAYVPYIVSDARLGKYGLSITSNPKPGDMVCYDWGWDGEFDHVGLFESGSASSFKAIEGNTSPANNSNGGEVMRRDRSTAQADIVFVRVREP